jgi:hypothetical protein
MHPWIFMHAPPSFSKTNQISNFYFLYFQQVSQRRNLTEGPAATWDLRRSKEEEEEDTSSNEHTNGGHRSTPLPL